MGTQLYLDTSVISVLDDDRSVDRRDMTREFWAKLATSHPHFAASISQVTLEEIEATLDATRKSSMLRRVAHLPVLPVSAEARALAARYLSAHIFPPSVPDDALHVAVAVLSRQDIIVSWNFKHLVNMRRRAAIQALHKSLGLPSIAIISPPEVLA